MPSTYRLASPGGLYGGGFGGIGSINYGPLAAPGNVLSVSNDRRAGPRVLTVPAPEALLLHHAYGTNGIIRRLSWRWRLRTSGLNVWTCLTISPMR